MLSAVRNFTHPVATPIVRWCSPLPSCQPRAAPDPSLFLSPRRGILGRPFQGLLALPADAAHVDARVPRWRALGDQAVDASPVETSLEIRPPPTLTFLASADCQSGAT